MNPAVYAVLYERIGVGMGTAALATLAQEPEFKGISIDTMAAIYRQKTQEHVRKHMSQHRVEWPNYYRQFLKIYRDNPQHDTMVTMALNKGIAPVVLARQMLRLSLQGNTAGETEATLSGRVNDYIKSPQLIQDEVLRAEIEECILADDVYSPSMDRYRHYIGLEYEYILKSMLQNLGVPFLDENRMRDLGYAKTPDIRLEVPIAVGGNVVNWIESKASFGDHYSHNRYLEEQIWPYQNRFGPGMVIYWFGFVDDLREKSDGLCIADDFPLNVVVLRPPQQNLTA